MQDAHSHWGWGPRDQQGTPDSVLVSQAFPSDPKRNENTHPHPNLDTNAHCSVILKSPNAHQLMNG